MLLTFAVWLICSGLAEAGSVVLQWDANTEPDIAGYIVLYGTTSGVYTNQLDVHNVTTATVVGLADCSRFYFVVRAYNTSGMQSANSVEVSTIVNPTTVPAAPSSPVPASAATGVATNTSLTWTSACMTTYAVKFGTTNPPPQVATGLATASYTPTAALVTGTTYFWQVVATNAAGSTTGPVWSFTTVAPPGAPASPSPASSATGVATNSTLSWTASGATSYTLNFGTTNPPPQLATGLASASYAPVLTTSKTYFWQIVATNAAGSTTGPVWSFTTAATTSAPGTPATPFPANNATGVSPSATLTWVSGGATSYAVKFGTTNPPPQVATGLTSASYKPTGTGLSANKVYFWQIVATNSAGSTTGPVWTFTTAASTAPTITGQPQNLTLSPGQNALFSVTASGGTLTYQWMKDGVAINGATGSTLSVSAVKVSDAGNYTVVVTNSAGSVTSNAATLQVKTLTIDESKLVFGATKAGSTGAISVVTPPQKVTVYFTGPTPTWTATSSQPWIQITNGSGTGAGIFTVQVINPNNVLGGATTLSGTVTITAANVGLTTTASVTIVVDLSNQGAPPFGGFDTPVDGSTGVQGSIAVTGWALDDVAVDRVEIWRDLVAGETTPPYGGAGPGNGKVFIANGTFINGARPDVETAYAKYPMAYRAGWGYLLLTWGLWNQGNGTYTLYAFAFDKDGHSTTLGTKRITVDNAHANKPFGALDTPSVGQTVSGSFWNYGWALTPGTTCKIINGNVSMAIDSGALVPVNYGAARTDIASGFPGLQNSTAAGGSVYLDTTALSLGTHQIGWYVVDNCGRADGIGSRFFNIAPAGTALVTEATASMPSFGAASSVTAAEPAWDWVGVRRNEGEWSTTDVTVDGTRIVDVNESDRVEIQLPSRDGKPWLGYQVVNGALRSLPIGSSLDAQTGRFSWHPAAGFVGAYDLQFVVQDSDTDVERVAIRLVVGPTMRMAIDTPVAGATTTSALAVAGWALDLASTDGTGIDGVEAWAFPVDGSSPISLGTATLGDARPDVAAVYGKQFEGSSFTVVADNLAPGTYDVTVYVHRQATGSYEAARTVRVTVN